MAEGTVAGRRAVVTGSNSGIGLGVARSLAGAGAEVVLNSFTDRPEDHDLAGIMPSAWASAHDRPAVAGADRRFTFTSPNVLVPGGAVSDIDSRIGCRELRHPILMLFCESGGSGVSRRCRG